MKRRATWFGLALALLPALSGCWLLRPSDGGGEGPLAPVRRVDPADVALPDGYRITAVAEGLTYPTAVGFDDKGGVYVAEAGYSYGEAWGTPKLLRVDAGGKTTPVAIGENPPWTGMSWHDGAFLVSEGGEARGGRILRVGLDGSSRALVSGLPSLGDHHTNRPVVGPDGYVYFGQGTATNAGVVGPDNYRFGWPPRHPEFHDLPARDVTLTGESFVSEDPRRPDGKTTVTTGPYQPFGTPASPGQLIKGRIPYSGGIMRFKAGGGPLEAVAWGLRNPFSLAFAPDGALYATENGADERGSRPIYGTGDCLWLVKTGTWYGWPDYAMGEPVSASRFNQATGNPRLGFMLAAHPQTPPKPAAIFGVHASANGMDFARSAAFGHVGEAFVAEFGDMAPDVGKALWPIGFRVVRTDPKTGVIADFAANKGPTNGPASRIGGGGLERPVDVRFDPSGSALYVVDFGVMAMPPQGPAPRPGTGVLWRIERAR